MHLVLLPMFAKGLSSGIMEMTISFVFDTSCGQQPRVEVAISFIILNCVNILKKGLGRSKYQETKSFMQRNIRQPR